MMRSLAVVAFATLCIAGVLAQFNPLPMEVNELELHPIPIPYPPRPGPTEPSDPEPNCSNDIGLVYGACNPKNPGLGGCSYARYDARYADRTNKLPPSLVVVNAKSAICADTNGGKGRSSLAYNAATRTEYFLTGTGLNLYVINSASGVQSVFAALPAAHGPIIGLELQGSKLYLVTDVDFYTVAVPAKNGTFSPFVAFPTAIKLSPNSFVTGNGKDLLYFYSDVLLKLFTVNTTTNTIVLPSPFLDFINNQVTQMFWSAKAGLIMAADGFLYRVDTTTGVGIDLKAPLPMNAMGATLSTTNYYAANATDMMAFNTASNPPALIKYSKILGQPIIGNFVFISP